MAWRACALALCWLAVAAAYTVDCNHEYTDCDTELSKLGADDDELPASSTLRHETKSKSAPIPFLPTVLPDTTTEAKNEKVTTTKAPEPPETTTENSKQARLLNLNVDELQNFANALHNDTVKSKNHKVDLSDVNMDEDDEDIPRRMTTSDHDTHKHDKVIPDKFYTNLQVPFHPLLNMDRSSTEETDTCKENEISYKIGDRIERGCEEICECSPGGTFDCTPRCKHPYIRRGRRLNDPLCFESPVDECCSIVACATGNHDVKATKVEVCRYNNETHQVGEKWHIGCEQSCSCETNSVVTCKPRCKKIVPSDKCINVQDPNDECCEVQICDVSQDVHEEPSDNVTSSTTTSTTTESIKGFDDYSDVIHQEHIKSSAPSLGPVSIESLTPKHNTAEPIGSVKVLQNNSVQVNLMHMNSSEDPIYLLLSSDGGKHFEDVELKYSNLILDLPGGKDYILKTKETGTKFNFTITASDKNMENDTMNVQEVKLGCQQDGLFYGIGEEFRIGCSELCECTGHNQKECVELVCPNHVGLELVSKGCVRWAPSPPPTPPNCCPRSARCLSDGTCHYKGYPVPNWSEVPISLTGCEQRCFCENGDLDCQEVCSPLPPLPPQTLRCPPAHRPAPVNISDEDCCKQWGCVPNADETNTTADSPYYIQMFPNGNFATPIDPVLPSVVTSVSPFTPVTTESIDFYRHLHPVKTLPKLIKTVIPVSVINEPRKYTDPPKIYPTVSRKDNITVFTPDDIEAPIKIIHSENLVTNPSIAWRGRPKIPDTLMDFKNPYSKHYPKIPDFVISDTAMHNLIQPSSDNLLKPPHKPFSNSVKGNTKFFLPADIRLSDNVDPLANNIIPVSNHYLFEPSKSENITAKFVAPKSKPIQYVESGYKQKHNKQESSGKALSSNPKHQESWKNVVAPDMKTHILIKAPNPYETVLLRPIASPRTLKRPTVQSPLGFDQLVYQMEVESEVNKNLGRSANYADTAAGPTPGPIAPQNPQAPQFLPTIPPEIHFPTEELPEYDQNNLHRPGSREPPIAGLPPGLTLPPNYGDENKKLSVLSIQADSPTSVKLLFGLPPVLVGLRGSVDLRYTDKADEDISRWYSQVFAPADEVLTTPRLEFRLTGLKPSTAYKIKGKLFLHNLPVEPESQVYSVRTLDLPSVMPVEEKRREVDSRLTVVDANDTAAHVSWRHFTEDELQFIDGIQVRYRPVGTPIYSMTELLHHSRSIAELRELRPGTRYEASLVLVPPPRASTELHDPARVEFTTSPFVDPYNWSVTIEAHVVGSDAAQLTWRGVPSPAERWVRVYRAAHACGATRHEHDAFRLAARDLPPTIMISGLGADTRCRVWLELFLTNGKIKTSNVIEINTKSEDSTEKIDNEIEAASVADNRSGGRGDYYGALVVVGVVAALGALTSLLLLLVLVRRHRPRSVPITPVPTAPRESSLPPYDNPAYKLELQQETMDL